MKPIKILQVCTVLNRGGAEVNLLNYYKHIDREKFHFDFLVHRFEEGALEKEIEEMGGRIFRISPLHPFTFRKCKREMRKFLDNHRDYDIIHNNTSELGFFMLKISRKLGFPIHIIHAHNSEIERDLKSPFRYLWRNRIRNISDNHFTCGKDAAIWLFGEKKAKEAWQMNNAIETQNFIWNPKSANQIKECENISGNMNFIHAGRFFRQKNHIFMLDVFAEIVKQKPEAKLYLAGDGELKTDIENKIKDYQLEKNVILLGVRNDVNQLLQAMDYFLFPSLFEGLPLAFIEAQATGIKCFISDGVPKEGILVKENVEVIPLQKSAKEWAETILKNLQYDRKDTSEVIRNTGYDIAENAKKLEEKYLELLNK